MGELIIHLIVIRVFVCLNSSVFPLSAMGQNIRISPKCEGRIEKSIRRIAVWHHEACRGMTNGDAKGQIFLS